MSFESDSWLWRSFIRFSTKWKWTFSLWSHQISKIARFGFFGLRLQKSRAHTKRMKPAHTGDLFQFFQSSSLFSDFVSIFLFCSIETLWAGSIRAPFLANSWFIFDESLILVCNRILQFVNHSLGTYRHKSKGKNKQPQEMKLKKYRKKQDEKNPIQQQDT